MTARSAALALALLLLAALVAVVGAADDPDRLVARVAFIRAGDVYVLDAATGRETRVTTDGAATEVWWTPDAGALYLRTRSGLRRWRPGGVAEEVRAGPWSPDGAAVALDQPLAGGEPGSAVWLEAGGQRHPLTPEEPWVGWTPRTWSPDGRLLALSRIQLIRSPVPTYNGAYPADGALVLVDRAGGGRRDVALPTEWGGATHSGHPDDVLWAPTGDRLAVWVGPPKPCASCRAGGAPVLAVDTRTGRTQPLGKALTRFGAVSWAPGGRLVVLSTPNGRETYWNKHLARVDLPSGARTELARDERYADTQPAVSPDGRRVVFARGWAQVDGKPRGPIDPELHPNVATIASRRLWLVGIDGAGAHRLLDAPGWTDDGPAWTPDGRWIVFVRWRPPKPAAPAAIELGAVRPDGSDARRLAPLSVPPDFTGFGYYGAFYWGEIVAVAPR